MNCSKTRELLSAYIDDELSADARTVVAQHLEKCAECTQELEMFHKLSTMAEGLSEPQPSADIWQQLEQQLDTDQESKPAPKSVPRTLLLSRLVAVAALILIALGLTIGYLNWFGQGHDHLAADFEHYLEEFLENPNEAQHVLLAKYKNVAVDVENAIHHVGYRPVAANALPAGYSLQAAYVLEMPCCKCVHILCKRDDNSVFAIFEHDEEQSIWFGERPAISVLCNRQTCRLVQMNDQLAATWKLGKRYVTVVGARDVDEVSQLVAFFANGEM